MVHFWRWIKDFFRTFGKCDICGRREPEFSDGVGIAWCGVCNEATRITRALEKIKKDQQNINEAMKEIYEKELNR